MSSERATVSKGSSGLPSSSSSHAREPWLPLYLLLLLAATLFPFWLHCRPGPFRLTLPVPFDLFQNIVLFVPLGVAMRRSGSLKCVLVAGVLSLGLEGLQPLVHRSPSLWDVMSNGAGAFLGQRVGHRADALLKRDLSPLVLLIAVALLVTCAVGSRYRLGAGFEDWQPMPLMIGNEPSMDRPWLGRVAELAIYDRGDPERERWGRDGPSSWRRGGPVLWTRFRSPVAARLDGPTGPRVFDPLARPTPEKTRVDSNGLLLEGGLWAFPDSVSRHVYERLVASDELSIYVDFEPSALSSIEPGRVLTMSRDAALRDFSIAQRDTEVVFRVRLPVTDENATHPDTTTTGSPLNLSEHRIWAFYNGRHTRIEVDGHCSGERLMGARRGWRPLAEPLGATLGVGCGFMAWGASGTARRLRRRNRIALGMLAGISFGLVLWALGVWSHLPHLGPWAAALTVMASGLGVRVGLAPVCSTVSQNRPLR
ncbi:VanZ family protein [Myxococcota bacterium]|nr:VanZ family protein [Myxococcota bacterium]